MQHEGVLQHCSAHTFLVMVFFALGAAAFLGAAACTCIPEQPSGSGLHMHLPDTKALCKPFLQHCTANNIVLMHACATSGHCEQLHVHFLAASAIKS